MNNNTPSPVSRRTLLRSGGAIVAGGAALAACGGSTKPESIARIGSVPEIEKLETEHVTDVALLRTAMSVEKMVATMLSDSRVVNLAESSVTPFISKYAAAHTTNMSVLAPLVTSRGGATVNEPNAKLMAAYGDTALELVEAGKTPDDVLNLTLALETLVAATYQYFVSLTNEAALRADMMRLGASSSRRAAAIAQLIRGGTAGFAPGLSEKGEELTATLPTAFGTLSAVQVLLGPLNEVGTRSPLAFDTPSLNSMLY